MDEVLKAVEEVREDFRREQDQATLQRNIDKACIALAGQDACDRVKRLLEARAGLRPQILRAATRPR